MKKETLIDLVEKWERDSETPETRDGSKEAERGNDVQDGERQGRLQCAEDLRDLINLVG